MPASRTLAEVTPPPPHPFWLTVIATLGGLVIPAIAAIAAALLLGPPQVPHASRAASLAAAALTIAEAIFAGLGAAAVVEAAWRRVGLPGSGPANFLPLRWIRHRIAHRNVQAIIDRLRQTPAAPSREAQKALLDLSRELARRDIYTRAHSGRVSRLSVEVGQKIGLSPEECELARLAGLLHDIGKLEIPTSILNKPGPLDPDEADLVRTHPTVGAALVSPYIGADVVNAVRHHHERVDGAGYPDGVDGDALPLIARLVPVVDTYDALISDRAYRPGRSREEAFMELRAVAGTQLDADLVEALIEVEKAKVPFGGALLGLAPMSGLVRRAEHLLHGSAAPAAAAVTAIAVAGAGWLGVMSNTAGSHVLASRSDQSIVQTSPSVPDQGSTDTPSPATDTPAGSPVPSPSDGATGKSVAPLFFPMAAGKGGKITGTQGVLVTPPTTSKNASGQTKTTTPTTIAVGPPSAPIPAPAPTPAPSKSPPPPPPSAPVVRGISPASGPSGIQVTINGSNFSGATLVRFGSNTASPFSVTSAQQGSGVVAEAGTQITVTAPPGTGAVPVTVSGPGGTSGAGVNFTYVGPTIATVSPLFGPVGGGTPVKLTGSSFTGTSKVIFGSQPAQSFHVDSDGQITAISPPFFGVQEFDIVVTTPVGTSNPAPNDQQFDYGPGITNNNSSSLTPNTGPWNGGTSVTIHGINFGSAPSVTFNGVAAQVTPVNDTTLMVTTPPQSTLAGANAAVVVTTAGGHSDGGPSFQYQPPPPPSISSLSPATGSGAATATVSVVITGNNFIATTFAPLTVSFGANIAACTVTSVTSITCKAPAAAAGTVVDVRVTTYGGQSAVTAGDKFTYTP
ncbi:MAG: diguanylate cyclase with sensor [Actinobacteria bacterium]|nr:diguanylate cyclase with sensor [Actinomycetota bacterium]